MGSTVWMIGYCPHPHIACSREEAVLNDEYSQVVPGLFMSAHTSANAAALRFLLASSPPCSDRGPQAIHQILHEEVSATTTDEISPQCDHRLPGGVGSHMMGIPRWVNTRGDWHQTLHEEVGAIFKSQNRLMMV
jgi:hypothetical protein